MSTRASRRSLTAADLKDHLHDIQDNVVAPILMRYGRHIFVKFTDGARARAWLRKMVDRVNARQHERGTRFTVNIGLHLRRTEGARSLQGLAGQLPECVSDRRARPCRRGGRCRAARAGALGGRLGRPRHPRDGVDSHRFRPGSRRGDAGPSRRDGCDRRGRGAVRPGHDGARARKRDRVGRASISDLPIRSRSLRSKAPASLRIPATACCSRMARGVR